MVGGEEEIVGAETGAVEMEVYLRALQLCDEYQCGGEEECIGESLSLFC